MCFAFLTLFFLFLSSFGMSVGGQMGIWVFFFFFFLFASFCFLECVGQMDGWVEVKSFVGGEERGVGEELVYLCINMQYANFIGFLLSVYVCLKASISFLRTYPCSFPIVSSLPTVGN